MEPVSAVSAEGGISKISMVWSRGHIRSQGWREQVMQLSTRQVRVVSGLTGAGLGR